MLNIVNNDGIIHHYCLVAQRLQFSFLNWMRRCKLVPSSDVKLLQTPYVDQYHLFRIAFLNINFFEIDYY